MLEDIIRMLQLDWLTFKLLRFTPLMLVDVTAMPLIVLYDVFNMRAWHLLEFDLSRETVAAVLGESGRALMRVNLNLWPAKLDNNKSE
jgi:hypothetical protein